MREPIQRLEGAVLSFGLQPFEGYRTADRQAMLLRQGATKAGPWRSAHQWGMAVDFAVVDQEDVSWHWPDPDSKVWRELYHAAHDIGLVIPIKWDKGHVQSPYWRIPS